MKCPSCGTENALTANFCSSCGFALVDNAGTTVDGGEEAPCRQCGVPVPIGAQFCGNCGVTSPHDADAGPGLRDRLIAGTPKREEDVTVPRGRVERATGDVVRDSTPGAEVPATKTQAPPASEPIKEATPPKPAGSPVAVPAGWPDVTEELAELRFNLLQGEDDEAKQLLEELQKRFPGHPDLATDLILDRSVVKRAPKGPEAAPPSVAAQTSATVVEPAAPEPTAVEAPVGAEPSQTVVTLPEKPSTPAKAPEAKPPVEPPVEPTIVHSRPIDDDGGDAPSETASQPSAIPELVTKSEGWGNVPDPGGTVIARAPSRALPNVLPVGTESRQVIIAEDGTVDADPTESTDGEATEAMTPVRNEVSATIVRATPDAAASAAEQPPATTRTVVVDGIQRPKPFRGEPGAAGGEVEEEWLEGGSALDLVVARPGRGAGPNTTLVSSDPQRPAPPAPFGGEAPPGSTMVPGTTPPKGGFPPLEEPMPDMDFEHRLPLAARVTAQKVIDDGVEEVMTRPMPPGEVPMTPLPDVPTTEEFAEEPATAEVVAGQPPEETESQAPERPEAPQTSDGTVIIANPLPPAPYQGKPPSQILPVRLVMLGSRGQPVAERTLAPGEVLDVGRDLSEPWGDDEYLEERHAQIRPAPGGGVSVDDLGGRGPVFRQVEHRRQIRAGDEFRVGQSLVTFFMDEDGARLEVTPERQSEPQLYPVTDGGLILGREEGDVVFPGDTYVSSSHCRFSVESNVPYVEDLGSSNGTYVRVRLEDTIEFGALLLLGHTQFRIQAIPDV